MRYPASEKVEIIRIVEQSSLSACQTLAQIGVPRATFYRWYDQYQTGGPEALEDNPSGPRRVWNRIPNDVRAAILELALEATELSPRELAVPQLALVGEAEKEVTDRWCRSLRADGTAGFNGMSPEIRWRPVERKQRNRTGTRASDRPIQKMKSAANGNAGSGRR